MTTEEGFWAGEFGDAYNRRNTGYEFLPARLAMFSRIMGVARGVESILELGCNTGGNLLALGMLGYQDLHGVEINERAARDASGIAEVTCGSLLETWCEPADMTLSAGVLIHIHPDDLGVAYQRLFEYSKRYVVLIEYYNPTPVGILYRGHEGRLWKRDFAGEMMDKFPLRLLDYGFIYHRDEFPQDDVNWFVMERI